VTFDEALAALDAWLGEPVVVTALPEGTTLRGRLATLDPAGIDGALFALVDGDGAPSGVVLALFRDGFGGARLEGDELAVDQGQMTHRVRRDADPPAAADAA
jgi:hypothetical protein